MTKISDLLKQRDTLRREAQKIIKTAEDADRAPEGQEQTRLDEIRTESDALETRIRNQAMMDEFDRQAEGDPLDGQGGEFEREASQVSLLRAIACSAGLEGDYGREREVSAELARRSGRKAQGVLVPANVLHVRAHRGLETRVTTAAGGGAGAIFESGRPDMFIDALRANLVTSALGATVLNGLEGGPVSLPAMDSGQSGSWIADDSALTPADVDVNKRQLTPKTVGCLTEFSRNFVLQSSPDVEDMARRDFSAALAVALDGAALVGGAANEPSGILDQITPGTLGTPTWQEVLNIVKGVEVANAAMGRLGWAVNPNAVATLRGTTKVNADAGAGFIMDSPRELAGYPAMSTTGLPVDESPENGSVVFGDWASLVVGYWTGIDILANPYAATAYAKGNIQVRGLLTADVVLRHVESFAGAIDVPAA
ncbi:phage major capsid protein [Pelagibius sp. CAU 1746]|uniref:phage major capsid protein n=1 Tax=Pelagibius sp. CAU 1746 TaxID=3140370 RepID=UPI00325ABF3D